MPADDTGQPLIGMFDLDEKLYKISGILFDNETISWVVRDYRLAQQFPIFLLENFYGPRSWWYHSIESSDGRGLMYSHHLRVVLVACVFAALRRRAYNAMTWSMSCTLLRSLTTQSTAYFLDRAEGEPYIWVNTSWYCLLTLPVAIFGMILAFPSALWATDEDKTLSSRGAVFCRGLIASVCAPFFAVANLLVGLGMLVPALLAGTTLATVTLLEHLTLWPVSQCLLPNVNQSVIVYHERKAMRPTPTSNLSLLSPLIAVAPRCLFDELMNDLHGGNFTRENYPEAYAFCHPG